MIAADAAGGGQERDDGDEAHIAAGAVPTSADNMATDEELLHELIGKTLSRGPATCADVTVTLLQRLAKSLNDIIGDEGFNSLLFRTAHRVGNDYPWLRFYPRSIPADPEFVAVRRCFEGQEPGQARAASMLLFCTFIDVLASLIGAHLTTLILNSALCGASAASSSKEQNDE